MEATIKMDNDPEVWARGLEGLIAINEDFLRKPGIAGDLPPLYLSGIVYRPEKNSEKWLTASQVYKDGKGDCEDLTGIRVAELRVSGVDPGAKAMIYQTGPKRWHAVVKGSDGTIEDPTKVVKWLEKQRKKALLAGDKMDETEYQNDDYGSEWSDPSQFFGGANPFDAYNDPIQAQYWGAQAYTQDYYGQAQQYYAPEYAPQYYQDPYGQYGYGQPYPPQYPPQYGQPYPPQYPPQYGQPYGYDPAQQQYAQQMDEYATQLEQQQREMRKAGQFQRMQARQQRELSQQKERFQKQMQEQRRAMRQQVREQNKALRERLQEQRAAQQAQRQAQRAAEKAARRAAWQPTGHHKRGWHL